ncbi:DMT family transporter, partial [Streptomyces europaeiscabiei]|uniref:DMT family transporter n=1 Tax=Streptomyces europaeiscabiei TaxID=146819 RepID=UPI0029A5D906
MAWVLLVVAGLLEVGWAVGMKYTDGFTRPLPSVLTGAGIVASMVLLSYAARTLPIGLSLINISQPTGQEGKSDGVFLF